MPIQWYLSILELASFVVIGSNASCWHKALARDQHPAMSLTSADVHLLHSLPADQVAWCCRCDCSHEQIWSSSNGCVPSWRLGRCAINLSSEPMFGERSTCFLVAVKMESAIVKPHCTLILHFGNEGGLVPSIDYALLLQAFLKLSTILQEATWIHASILRSSATSASGSILIMARASGQS